MGESERIAQKNFDPFLLFPQITEQKENIKIMQLEIGRGLAGVNKITLWRKKGETSFRIRQANNFFAKQELANRLLYGSATLNAEASRNPSRESLEKLGLIAPDKLGPAVRIGFYLFEPHNTKLVSFLVGARPEKISDVLGQSFIYVKREDTQQVYLARGALPLRTQMKDWVDFDFFRLALKEPAFNLAKAQFSLCRKKGWVLQRKNEQSRWLLSDRSGVPLAGVYDVKRIAAIEDNLKRLRFQAVQPSKNIKFKCADIVIFESFSGLAIIFEIVKNNTGFWAKISARAKSQPAQSQSQKLRHYLDEFVFQLSPQAAQRMALMPAQLKKKPRAKSRRAR
jgi:hypothetical protein